MVVGCWPASGGPARTKLIKDNYEATTTAHVFADVTKPEVTFVSGNGAVRDERLPLPGTVLKRKYKGQVIRALILEYGFEYDGEIYDSLSALVTKVTGTRWNGYQFFGLTMKEASNG